MRGAANTATLPDATLSGVKVNHCIGSFSLPVPGSAGMPAVNVASNMNELFVVLPLAFDVERVGPEPPGSSGFFQMYDATGPEFGESPQYQS